MRLPTSPLFSLAVALGSALVTARTAPRLNLNNEFGMMDTRQASSMSAPDKKGVMFMNRIGPSASELYVADVDGSNERKLLQDSHFEYHASFSPDGYLIPYPRVVGIYNSLLNNELLEMKENNPFPV